MGQLQDFPRSWSSSWLQIRLSAPAHRLEASSCQGLVLLSLQLALLWTGAARAEAIKPWMGNNSNSIILTQIQARKRNCRRWLRKQEPLKQQQEQQQDGEEEEGAGEGRRREEERGGEGRRRRRRYWLFSLAPSQTWPWIWLMLLLSASLQFSFSKACHRKEG